MNDYTTKREALGDLIEIFFDSEGIDLIFGLLIICFCLLVISVFQVILRLRDDEKKNSKVSVLEYEIIFGSVVVLLVYLWRFF
ncbi:MAG: hypothetical protein JJ966_04485 [Balneolaceae bacterium]|nr:hypothetical protein [Balneolaceae bacterium]